MSVTVEPTSDVAPSRIRPAGTQEERERFYRLRYELLVEGAKKAPPADHERRQLVDPLDATAVHLLAPPDDPAGALRVNYSGDFTEENRLPPRLILQYGLEPFLAYAGGKLAFTSPPCLVRDRRGAAVVQGLFEEAYGQALDRGVLFDFCLASPYLVERYEQLGYRRYRRNIADPKSGYAVPLVLVVRDWGHLQAINSPLLDIARKRGDDGERHASVTWFDSKFAYNAPSQIGQWEAQQFAAAFLHSQFPQADPAPSLFEGLHGEETRAFVRRGLVVHGKAGERIVHDGDGRDEMYIVLRGRVAVRKRARVLAELGPGQVFGEMAMVTRTLRSAHVDAIEDVDLLVFTRQELDRTIRSVPLLATQLLMNLSRILSVRLTLTNGALASIGKERGDAA